MWFSPLWVLVALSEHHATGPPQTQLIGEAFLKWDWFVSEGQFGTDRIASVWKIILTNAGVEVNVFADGAGKIITAVPDAASRDRVIEFATSTQDDLLD